MAAFLVAFNLLPAEYMKLTLLEREAIVKVANKRR
mgnify:CR=1 FL=1